MSLIRFAGIVAALVAVGLHSTNGRATTTQTRIFSITPNAEENALDISVSSPDGIRAVGKLGLSLPSSVGNWTNCNNEPSCFQWGDFAQVELLPGPAVGCGRVKWTSTFAKVIEDCYDLQSGVHWYGGGETHTQLWPIEANARELRPYVTGDFFRDINFYGGVVENYWLLSNGAAIVVDPTTPLFFSLNTTRPNKVCFVAKDESPYEKREVLTMEYKWCTGANVKTVHQAAMSTFFEKPNEIPDENMIIRPFWSTWAEYHEPINQTLVLDYARKVVSEGFVNTSHIEIDDFWETCRGEEAFDPVKFPDPKAMIDEIHDMGFKVTIWIHPFINYECPLFNEGMSNGYFVKDSKPRTGITWWWQGENTGIIDMTNPAATNWWTARLKKLQTDYNLDSFKFDAGEVNFLPADIQLNNDTDRRRICENILSRCKTIALDGTFDVVTSIYEQLFTIHGITDDGWTFPLVYALLPNKVTISYLYVFNSIARHGTLEPDVIIMDFEKAMINAAGKAFPNSELQGCHFHFVQALYRRMSTDLKNMFNQDREFSMLIRKVFALPFVKVEHVFNAFELIEEEVNLSPALRNELEDFLSYFQSMYMGKTGKPRYPPKFWSVHNRVLSNTPRTNNSVEAWNRRLQVIADGSHIPLHRLLKLIRGEHKVTQVVMAQKNAGEPTKARRFQQVSLDRRLQNLVQDYENYTLAGFLKGVSFNMTTKKHKKRKYNETDMNDAVEDPSEEIVSNKRSKEMEANVSEEITQPIVPITLFAPQCSTAPVRKKRGRPPGSKRN